MNTYRNSRITFHHFGSDAIMQLMPYNQNAVLKPSRGPYYIKFRNNAINLDGLCKNSSKVNRHWKSNWKNYKISGNKLEPHVFLNFQLDFKAPSPYQMVSQNVITLHPANISNQKFLKKSSLATFFFCFFLSVSAV